MSVYKKTFPSSEKENIDAGAVAAARTEFTRRLILTSLALILVCLATFSYISKAWFANNKNVDANNASVTTETPTASLFINAGTLPDGLYKIEDIVNTEIRLFPISTINCKDWYYVNGWKRSDGKVFANSYAKAADIGSDGLYYNEYEERDLYAYSLAQFNVYSNVGSMEVYLDPENPITVTYPETSTKQIDKAVRIGLAADTDGNGEEELVLVYAPAETQVGNSDGQSEVKFYAVDGTGLCAAEAVYTISSDWTQFAAKKKIGFDDKYEKNGDVSKLICTTDNNGQVVSVYIWLEGTDGETVLGVSEDGNITNDGLSVHLKLVGVLKNN
ncbi:MAG: hypothetical protein PUB32_00955 [Clostridiales bacterium]|nr:hypothetical protein [Clostridiales bacterium]